MILELGKFYTFIGDHCKYKVVYINPDLDNNNYNKVVLFCFDVKYNKFSEYCYANLKGVTRSNSTLVEYKKPVIIKKWLRVNKDEANEYCVHALPQHTASSYDHAILIEIDLSKPVGQRVRDVA